MSSATKSLAGVFCILAALAALSNATFYCNVISAYDGSTVSGALCSLRSTNESILYGSANTDSNGAATINYQFTAGTYLGRVGHPDFYVADQTFMVSSGTDYTITISVSPILNTTAVRAVLRWGAQPSDLDSWTYINSSAFDSCTSVSYGNKNCFGGDGRINLDLDDQSSYGPETTTFTSLPVGSYAFWVYVYTSGGAFVNSDLPVTVDLYTGNTGNGVFRTFTVPTSTPTNLRSWHVFDIVVAESTTNPGCLTLTIQPVNTFSVDKIPGERGPAQENLLIGQACSVSSSVCNTRRTGAWKTCGQFGDPHIITWNTTGVTCRAEGTQLLVDNEWFSLGMHNIQVDDVSGATSTDIIRFIYKQCNPMTIVVTPGNFPDPVNAVDAGVHLVRKEGNNIYLDALNTRIQIRQSGDYLIFGLSTPFWNGPGLCNGCAAGDELDTNAPSNKRRNNPALPAKREVANVFDFTTANATCAEAGLTDFFLRACIFDLITTGNETYVHQATSAVQTYHEVQQPFQDDSVPVSQGPTGDASSVAASLVLLIAVAILALSWM